jgi:hypothetical protein
MARQYFYAAILVLFVQKLCYTDERVPIEQVQVLGKHPQADVRENGAQGLKRQKNEKEEQDTEVTFREFGPPLDDVESTTISTLEEFERICVADFLCVQHPGTNYRYMTTLYSLMQTDEESDPLYNQSVEKLLDIPWRIYLRPRNLVDLPRPIFLLISANDLLNEIQSEHIRNGVLYAIRELLDYCRYHFKKESDSKKEAKVFFPEEDIPSERRKHFNRSIEYTTYNDEKGALYSKMSHFWTDTFGKRFLNSNVLEFLFRICHDIKIEPHLKIQFEQRIHQLPRQMKKIFYERFVQGSANSFDSVIFSQLNSLFKKKESDVGFPIAHFALNLLMPPLINAGKVKQYIQPQLVQLDSLEGVIGWRDLAYLDLEHRKSFYYPDETINFTKYLFCDATWEDIKDHSLGDVLMRYPRLFSMILFTHPSLVPDECIENVRNINHGCFEVTYINNVSAVYLCKALEDCEKIAVWSQKHPHEMRRKFDSLPPKIKAHYQRWKLEKQAMQNRGNLPVAPAQALPQVMPPREAPPQGIIHAVPPAALPAAVPAPLVPQPLKGIERKWRFDPSKVRSATDVELQPLHAFRHHLLMSELDHKGKELALEFLDGTEILAKNNPVICTELFACGNLYSQLFHVREPRDLVLHPEQSDAPLEQRAFNSLAAIRAVWDAIKDDHVAQKHCIEEAFSHAPCYEAKTKGLIDWLEAYFDPTKPETQRIMTKQDLLRRLIQTKIREIERSMPDVDKLESIQILLTQIREGPNRINYTLIRNAIVEQAAKLKLMQERWRQFHLYEAVYNYACGKLEGKLAKDGIITQLDIDRYLTSILSWSPLDFYPYVEAA